MNNRAVAAATLIALLLPLASCADPTVGATTQPTSTPSARSEPPAKSQPPAKAKPKTKPKTEVKAKTKAKAKAKTKAKAKAEVPATRLFGTQYAYLRSAKANRITFDLVQYFEYEDASKACEADHVDASEGVWCVDYYIRNKNPRLRTLGADPAGPYRLLTQNGPVEVSLGKFIAAMRGKDRVFKFYVDAGRILYADEVPA